MDSICCFLRCLLYEFDDLNLKAECGCEIAEAGGTELLESYCFSAFSLAVMEVASVPSLLLETAR